MALDQRLIEILACPQDKGPLFYIADEDLLYNPRLHLAYAVRDDIPVMLPGEARTIDDAEHERIMTKVADQGITPTFGS